MPIYNGSPMGHVGLRSEISVSDEASQSSIRHVGLRLGSDEACWSLMRHVGI